MRSDSSTDPFTARHERLRMLMEARRVPLVLITNLFNIRYLTGFRGSAGVAVFGPTEALLWVDPRYTLQAREQARGVEVTEGKKGLLIAVAAWTQKYKVRRIGYEASHCTCADFQLLVRETHSRVCFKSVAGLVEELRAVKDQEESAHIRAAGRVTMEVFEEVRRLIRPGVSESDLAAEIDYRMRKAGAERAAFEAIVASGPRGAFPHAHATSKLLEENELVVVDLGAILDGYAADMTRTVHLGEPSRRVRGLYSAVVEAQRRAVEAVRDGAQAGRVDAVARRILAKHGLAKYFTHSTGHGVGLEVHEWPRLGRGEKTRLRTGCVVTVEPGVYLQGFGGIRVEDTVLVGPEGPEILTPAPKDHWVLN